jgi:hypothetical protein
VQLVVSGRWSVLVKLDGKHVVLELRGEALAQVYERHISPAEVERAAFRVGDGKPHSACGSDASPTEKLVRNELHGKADPTLNPRRAERDHAGKRQRLLGHLGLGSGPPYRVHPSHLVVKTLFHPKDGRADLLVRSIPVLHLQEVIIEPMKGVECTGPQLCVVEETVCVCV